jgi:hypothetical protein
VSGEADIALLERIMVDFAAGEPTEVVAPQIEELLANPPAALEACIGVLVATARVAADSGLVPLAGPDAFYGLQVVERRPGALADLDPLERARHISMQALTAALNADWLAVTDLLVGPLGSSYHESIATFHQCLVLWRSLVNTTEGALAVQLLGLGESDGTPE